MYIPEGPTLDDLGQIYFSRLYPQEDVNLVVLNPESGERAWTLPHKGDSKGAVLARTTVEQLLATPFELLGKSAASAARHMNPEVNSAAL